jgi:hypothetical protein
MLLNGKFSSEYTDNYYVIPNYEEKKWIKGEGEIQVEDDKIRGHEIDLKKTFTPTNIIGIPSSDETIWYLPSLKLSNKKLMSIYKVEEVEEDKIRVKLLNDIPAKQNTKLSFYYQAGKKMSIEYKNSITAIGRLDFLEIGNGISWLKSLRLPSRRVHITVKTQLTDHPSESFGPYFRLLLSSSDNITNDTIEFSYDNTNGFLLRQIVSLLSKE